MATYDSDSSGQLDDYTETSTLLGFASKEATDDSFSQLGGYPTWLDLKTAPSAALARCKICNDYMSLLLQLNGDLPEKFPGHERRLYLFSCRRKTCRRKEGSIRGVRASRISRAKAKAVPTPQISESKPEQPLQNIGNQLFGGKSTTGTNSGANPFSANPFSTGASSNPFASASELAAKPAQKPVTSDLSETFASKARLSDSSQPQDPAFNSPKPAAAPEPWPQDSAFPPPYPKYYLDADYETLDKPKTAEAPHAANNLGNFDDTEMGGTSSSGGGVEQLFESSMDKTFQKFADRLEQNPEQVLRYEYAGQPLLYSSTDAVGKRLAPEHTAAPTSKVGTVKQGGGIPKCATCGMESVFELQLAPHAITELEADEMSLEGMDWGTILLGVCSNDCVPGDTPEGTVGYVEEWCGVQWEELTKR